MPIPVKIKAASELIGETVVAEVLASWSIEEIKQLLNEVEAELRKRPIPHARLSRRARSPRLMH
jgi:hypothetical protein